MTTHTQVDIARSDVVGSLLRPAYLREARQGVREGRVEVDGEEVGRPQTQWSLAA